MNDEISFPRKIHSAVNEAAHTATITSRMRIRRMDLQIYPACSFKLCARTGSSCSLSELTRAEARCHSTELLRPLHNPVVSRRHEFSLCESPAGAGVP